MVMNTMGSNPYKKHQQVNNCKSISFTFLFFFLSLTPHEIYKNSLLLHTPPQWPKKQSLVGGWTNPSEKYARQIGFIFPK